MMTTLLQAAQVVVAVVVSLGINLSIVCRGYFYLPRATLKAHTTLNYINLNEAGLTNIQPLLFVVVVARPQNLLHLYGLPWPLSAHYRKYMRQSSVTSL